MSNNFNDATKLEIMLTTVCQVIKAKDYHSYLDQYREFLESAEDSTEIKALLGV